MRRVRLIRPDDWHVHLRDDDLLQHTAPATARVFARALVMPNLQPALTTVDAVLAYQTRILDVLPQHSAFTPYMTLYLNESVTEAELKRAAEQPFILGAKLYPQGVTTHSIEGVRDLRKIYPLLELMQALDLVLQIHGETIEGDVNEREMLFLKQALAPLIRHFPRLRIVLEHISTKAAVDFVLNAPETVAATITPHHLLYNRNHMLSGGIRPHLYCLPILKHADDQVALQTVALSGHPRFFAGTDSAPHVQSKKENGCGCAGIYSAPYALSFYAQMFADAEQLSRLESFVSIFGADFYKLPHNKTEIELTSEVSYIPSVLPLGDHFVVPMGAGTQLKWSIHV